MLPSLSAPVPGMELRKAGEHLVSVDAKLAGEPLQDISGLNYEKQWILATDLAAFLNELHSIPTAMGCLLP